MIIVDVIMVVGVHCYVAKNCVCSRLNTTSDFNNFFFSKASGRVASPESATYLIILLLKLKFCWCQWVFSFFDWYYQSLSQQGTLMRTCIVETVCPFPLNWFLPMLNSVALSLEINLCNLFVQILFFLTLLNAITRGVCLFYQFIEIDWGELDV